MNLSRRRFLGHAVSGLVTAGLAATGWATTGWAMSPSSGVAAAAGSGEWLTRPAGLLPASGQSVHLPMLGLGTWQTFGLHDGDNARRILSRFHALGGRLVDTSPMYGSAETALGHYGADLEIAPDLFLATKVWTSGEAAGQMQIRQSMTRLRKQPLDLLQIHNLLDWQTHLPTLRELQAEGRVRFIGITHYTASSHDRLARIIQREPLDFLQVNYNLAARQAAEHLLPSAQERGMAVIINRPFQGGSLFAATRGRPLPDWAADIGCTSFAQIFLKYILSHPAVTVAIPATSKLHHLEDNMAAARGPLPDKAQRRRIAAWFDGL